MSNTFDTKPNELVVMASIMAIWTGPFALCYAWKSFKQWRWRRNLRKSEGKNV